MQENFHLALGQQRKNFRFFHQFTTYAEFGDWTEIPKNLKFSKKSEILGFEKISRKLFQFFCLIKRKKSYQNMNAENRTAHYLKYLCGHGKYKYQCKECKGSQICPHSRRKSECKECKGSQICAHNRQKAHCKKCSDPIKVNIKQWIFNSRQYDKMNNIYDADRFIDKCFLKGLVEDYKQCYYRDCKVNFQYTEYQNDLATIERLDNSIGHIKSNCVLCCFKCNLLKKWNEVN